MKNIFIKLLRLLAGVCLIYGNFILAGFLVVAAEMIGIERKLWDIFVNRKYNERDEN